MHIRQIIGLSKLAAFDFLSSKARIIARMVLCALSSYIHPLANLQRILTILSCITELVLFTSSYLLEEVTLWVYSLTWKLKNAAILMPLPCSCMKKAITAGPARSIPQLDSKDRKRHERQYHTVDSQRRSEVRPSRISTTSPGMYEQVEIRY